MGIEGVGRDKKKGQGTTTTVYCRFKIKCTAWFIVITYCINNSRVCIYI